MTDTKIAERTWTSVGAEHTGEAARKTIQKAIDGLEWQPVPCEMAAGPGLALKGLVQELRLPKVSHVADSHELAPYSLIAIRCHYKNGMCELFAIDIGTEVIPLCSDFYATA